jgi:hypothetical protein
MDYKKKYNFLKNLLTAPFIWFLVIPLLILDFFIELYHRICFPLYGLPLINRSQFFNFDRRKLSYLKWWEQLGCLYCSYANGLLPYCSAIAAATEKYWCAIKHPTNPNFHEPEHHKQFLEYNDENAYRDLEENYQNLQKNKDKNKK